MKVWPIRGIIVPIVTPLRGNDELDEAGLERLVERLIGGGVHGLFVLGTTGEGPALPRPTRRELVARVCKQAGKRVPVLVGMLETAYADFLDVSTLAAESGADGVVAAPPYYAPMSQADLVRFMERLSNQVALPIVLYNTPHDPMRFELESLDEIAAMPRVIGLKDSSGDRAYLGQLLEWRRKFPSFAVYCGPEEFLPFTLQQGGHGGVSGGGNLFPELYVAWYEALHSDDKARAARCAALVEIVWKQIYTVGDRNSSIVRGLKCALSLLGVCGEQLATPFEASTEEQRQRVKMYLDEYLSNEIAQSLVQREPQFG